MTENIRKTLKGQKKMFKRKRRRKEEKNNRQRYPKSLDHREWKGSL